MAEDGKRVMHAALSIGGQPLFSTMTFPRCAVATRPPPGAQGTPVTMHLDCPQVDTLWAQATAAGATRRCRLPTSSGATVTASSATLRPPVVDGDAERKEELVALSYSGAALLVALCCRYPATVRRCDRRSKQPADQPLHQTPWLIGVLPRR